MIAPEYFNNHIAIEGEIIVKRVPNDTGSVLVWNSTTKKISTRTVSEIVSDLSLMTTNTEQDISNRKWFYTSGGSNWDNSTLGIMSQDGSNPTIAFYKGGINIAGLSYDGGTFHFNNNGNVNDYSNVKAASFIKNGSSNDYFLMGGGGHLAKYSKDDSFVNSGRNFVNGTLITTNIDYSQTEGESFLLEMKGNMYGGGSIPMDCKLEGYIYANTLINCSGYATNPLLTNMVAMNIGGNLCFWFPRLSYWNGFSVKIVTTGGGGITTVNRVTSIDDSVEPSGTKKVTIPIQTLATSGQLGNYWTINNTIDYLNLNYLKLSGGTLTGGGRIDGAGNIFVQQHNNGGNATGMFWESLDNAQNIAGFGVYTENGDFKWNYIGWGASPWSQTENLSIAENIFHYKNRRVWHEGILEDYHQYGLGSYTQQNQINIDNPRESGFYSYFSGATTGTAPFNYATILHQAYMGVNEFSQIAVQKGGEGMAFRTDTTPWRKVYHEGNFNPLNYPTTNQTVLLDSSGGISDGSGSRTNRFWFDYNWAGTGGAGSVINFSGLGGGYSTELFASYAGEPRIGFRARNGDAGSWNLHNWLWHTGNLNPTNFVLKSGDTMTGDLNTNAFSSGRDTLGTYIESRNNTAGFRIQYDKGNGIYNQLLIQDILRFNNNEVWHAGNFNPDNYQPSGQYVRIGGQSTTGNNILLGWTGSELRLTVDATNIGDLWHTSNFNPNTKVNGSENAKAIGFSSGSYPTTNGAEYPYFYYDNGSTTGYIPLATQDFVNYKVGDRKRIRTYLFDFDYTGTVVERLYLPSNNPFVLDLKITAYYQNYNVAGLLELKISYAVAGNWIYQSDFKCTQVQGATDQVAFVEENIYFDSTNNRPYINIHKKLPSDNRIFIQATIRALDPILADNSIWIQDDTNTTVSNESNEVDYWEKYSDPNPIGYRGINDNDSRNFSFLENDANVAKKINVGGLLISDAYGDQTKIPTNGAYVKGLIKADSKVISNYTGSTSGQNLGSGGIGNTLELRNYDAYGTSFWSNDNGWGFIQQQRFDGQQIAYDLRLQPLGGLLYYGNNIVATVNQFDSYYTKNEALNLFVGLNGVQTIYDTKIFNSSPIIPNGTLGTHAVNLSQLSNYATTAQLNDYVTVNTPQNISGLKTFYNTLAIANGQSIFLKGSADTAHYIKHFADDKDGFGVSTGFAVKRYDEAVDLFTVSSVGFGEFNQNVRAGGFLKANSSNDYVLLGQGDHKPLSDFATNDYLPNHNWGGHQAISGRKTVGELAWKNYGSGHTIFDISSGVAPWGVSKSNVDAEIPWSPSYPTLVGGNGANTYGVRVDSARVSDNTNALGGVGSDGWVRNMENTYGIGFQNGNVNLAPYFYHSSGTYKFLATQEWVNTNFIPKSHPVYNITQADINSWNSAGSGGSSHTHSNLNLLNNIDQWLGVGQTPSFGNVRLMNYLGYGLLALEEGYFGREIGLVDLDNKVIYAGRENEYLKYGSSVNDFEGLNIHFDAKLLSIGKEITNHEDKVQVGGNISVNTINIGGSNMQLILNPLHNTDGDVRGSRNAHIYIVTRGTVRLPSKPILGQRIEIFNFSANDIEVMHENVGTLFNVPGFGKITGIVGGKGFIFDEKPIPAKHYGI